MDLIGGVSFNGGPSWIVIHRQVDGKLASNIRYRNLFVLDFTNGPGVLYAQL